MIRRQFLLHAAAVMAVVAACAVRPRVELAAACQAVVGGGPAAGAALQDCLDQLDPGATLALPPVRLVLTQPVTLRRRVRLTTQGAPDCLAGAPCAILALRMPPSRQHALSVVAAGTVLDGIVVEGGRADPARDDTAACTGADRPSMGALLVEARDVTIVRSVVRDAACYSAIVVTPAAERFRLTHSAVLANGRHDRGLWADGLTVLDGTGVVVEDTLFRDNTDVQLVLGGCRGCRVAGNRIETTEAPDAGSYAGLLVHAWPTTSGDYTGTAITGNAIDCGAARHCGFGLGVGGRAWYASATSGGVVAGNTVRRAQVGINVDDATGPVTMRNNTVSESGGPVRSHCGLWFAGPVNISPASRPFVDATAGVAMPAEAVTVRSFAGCLPGT